MFTTNPIVGVIMAVIFICGITWFLIEKTKKLIIEDKILFVLIFLIGIMTSTFVADRVIAFNIKLLSEDESKQIFSMINYILTTVLGYYFGTKKKEP